MFSGFNLKFNSFLLVILTLHALCISHVHGSCLPCNAANRRDTAWDANFARRGVYSPKVMKPSFDTVWTVGSDVLVTWDTSDMPKDVTNPKGTLILGYLDDGDNENEHLDLKHPLAAGFDLGAGYVSVKVPKVSSRKNYIVVLFGDSGNRSQTFTIKSDLA